jgi:hypothetical protein
MKGCRSVTAQFIRIGLLSVICFSGLWVLERRSAAGLQADHWTKIDKAVDDSLAF